MRGYRRLVFRTLIIVIVTLMTSRVMAFESLANKKFLEIRQARRSR